MPTLPIRYENTPLADRVPIVFFHIAVMGVFVSPEMSVSLFPVSITIGNSGIIRVDEVLTLITVTYSFALLAYSNRYKLELIISPQFLLSLIMGFIMVISTLYVTILQGVPLQFGSIFELLRWLTFIGFLGVLPIFISLKDAGSIIKFVITLSFIISLFAILQYIIGGYWTELAKLYTNYPVSYRAAGVAKNPNYLAQLLIPGFLISYSLLISWINSSKRDGNNQTSSGLYGFTSFLSVITIGSAIIITYSRIALIGAITGVIVVTLVFTSNEEINELPGQKIVSVLFIIIIVLVLLFTQNDIQLGRYQTLLNISEAESLIKRLQIWNSILPIISAKPIVGHGLTLYPIETQLGSPIVDSGLIRWIYHFGIAGFFIIVTLIFTILKMALHITFRLSQSHIINRAGALGVIGFTVAFWPIWLFEPVIISDRTVVILIFLTTIIIGMFMRLSQ